MDAFPSSKKQGECIPPIAIVACGNLAKPFQSFDDILRLLPWLVPRNLGWRPKSRWDLKPRIPTGFRNKAQGCRACEATLGKRPPSAINPNGVAPGRASILQVPLVKFHTVLPQQRPQLILKTYLSTIGHAFRDRGGTLSGFSPFALRPRVGSQARQP